MIARKIELILTDRQYEALCQSVAKSGRTVASVVQKFAEDLPKDETIINGWRSIMRRISCRI